MVEGEIIFFGHDVVLKLIPGAFVRAVSCLAAGPVKRLKALEEDAIRS